MLNETKRWIHLKLATLFCSPIWQYSGKANNIVEATWRIYNETPIRQNRKFPHYGESMEMISASLAGSFNNLNCLVFVYPDSRSCVSTVCLRGCVEKHLEHGIFRKINAVKEMELKKHE